MGPGFAFFVSFIWTRPGLFNASKVLIIIVHITPVFFL